MLRCLRHTSTVQVSSSSSHLVACQLSVRLLRLMLRCLHRCLVRGLLLPPRLALLQLHLLAAARLWVSTETAQEREIKQAGAEEVPMGSAKVMTKVAKDKGQITQLTCC